MPGVAERFWSKVDRQHDCWGLDRRPPPQGYGLFKRDGKLELAVRSEYARTPAPTCCWRCQSASSE
jgi:hypothetical protein